MSRLHVLATCSVAFLLMRCQSETVTPVSVPYDGRVDQRLVSYFRQFEAEAAARGVEVDFDKSQITGAIQSIQEDNIAGTCSYHSQYPNVVTIDLEYWNGSSTLRREMVVFHELGHCILGRGHDESQFENGVCTTIMNSGTSGCFVAYTTQNREYYLDELFSR